MKEEIKLELTPRQKMLRAWLNDNFVSGKFFTIEEVVEGFVDQEGNPFYKLNHDPYKHDKCYALSKDVKDINWLVGIQGYVPIIKDRKGSMKLCESKTEFDEFYNLQEKRVVRHYQYLNTLKSMVEMDGYIPMVNQNNRAVSADEQQPIDTYKR